MPNRKKNKTILPVIVTSETLESFFLRGRKIAQKIDQKIAPFARRVISFEDTKDLINFLTQNKLKLVATIRKRPCSVSGLAKILKRSRAAVNKDIQQLESVGIIKSEYVLNPGHGRSKLVMAVDPMPVQIQVQAVI